MRPIIIGILILFLSTLALAKPPRKIYTKRAVRKNKVKSIFDDIFGPEMDQINQIIEPIITYAPQLFAGIAEGAFRINTKDPFMCLNFGFSLAESTFNLGSDYYSKN